MAKRMGYEKIQLNVDVIDTAGTPLSEIADFVNKDKDMGEPCIFAGELTEGEVEEIKRAANEYNTKKDIIAKTGFEERIKEYIGEFISVSRDVRNTDTSIHQEAASHYHREFNNRPTMNNSTYDYNWVCLVYINMENCKRNCLTKIMYYNKNNRCREINLQHTPGKTEFILFRDCHFIHIVPDSIANETTKPVKRTLFRMYIQTEEAGHELCDTRLRFNSVNIDTEIKNAALVDSVNITRTNIPIPTDEDLLAEPFQPMIEEKPIIEDPTIETYYEPPVNPAFYLAGTEFLDINGKKHKTTVGQYLGKGLYYKGIQVWKIKKSNGGKTLRRKKYKKHTKKRKFIRK